MSGIKYIDFESKDLSRGVNIQGIYEEIENNTRPVYVKGLRYGLIDLPACITSFRSVDSIFYGTISAVYTETGADTYQLKIESDDDVSIVTFTH